LFLWLFWPSFNAAIATGATAHRAIVNTLLALTGSCMAAFLSSHALRREAKFSMVDIQNATLAGGVAIGANADLLITPGPAVAIGALAGFVSVLGYSFIQAWLEENIGLHDTCGVNNLHGMPSLLGAFASLISAYQASFDTYGDAQMALIYPARGTTLLPDRSASRQAAYQFAFMVITVCIGFSSGTFTGLIVRNKFFEPIDDENLFQDNGDWEVPELEIPYYYDHRGEISRDHNQPPQESPTSPRRESINSAGNNANQMLVSRLIDLENQLQTLKKNKLTPNKLEQLFERIANKLEEKTN